MVVHLFLNNNKALDFLPINSIKNGGITPIIAILKQTEAGHLYQKYAESARTLHYDKLLNRQLRQLHFEPPRVSRRPNFLREYPNEKYLLT